MHRLRRGDPPALRRARGARRRPEGGAVVTRQAVLLLDGKITGVELSRWAEMLADERPRWRATAARLATVSGATPLVPALVAALEKEAEPGVAHAEMIALASSRPARRTPRSSRQRGALPAPSTAPSSAA